MKEACIQCCALVTMPPDYNPHKQFPVCSMECFNKEKQFRFMYSDEAIGKRCYEEHGVNPAVMWGKHAESIKSYAKQTPKKPS